MLGSLPLRVTSPPTKPNVHAGHPMTQYLQYQCTHPQRPADPELLLEYREWQRAECRVARHHARVEEHMKSGKPNVMIATATASVTASVLGEDVASLYDALPYGDDDDLATTTFHALQKQREWDRLLLSCYTPDMVKRLHANAERAVPSTWWGQPHHGDNTQSRCRVCLFMVDPLPRERMFGVGFYECTQCPNRWYEPSDLLASKVECTFQAVSTCPTCSREVLPVYLGPARIELCQRWTAAYRAYHYKRSLYEAHLSNVRRRQQATLPPSPTRANAGAMRPPHRPQPRQRYVITMPTSPAIASVATE